MSYTAGNSAMADRATLGGSTIAGDHIAASDVSGTSVYNTDGDKLGSIDDIVIGKRDGQVKYAVMSFGGFLGIGEEYHPLPWEILKYDERQGGYVVGLTIDQLKGAPRFHRDAQPAWSDPAYGRGIDNYYLGITPII